MAKQQQLMAYQQQQQLQARLQNTLLNTASEQRKRWLSFDLYDRKRSAKPDVHTPFRSLDEALHRLAVYHTYDTLLPSDAKHAEFDEQMTKHVMLLYEKMHDLETRFVTAIRHDSSSCVPDAPPPVTLFDDASASASASDADTDEEADAEAAVAPAKAEAAGADADAPMAPAPAAAAAAVKAAAPERIRFSTAAPAALSVAPSGAGDAHEQALNYRLSIAVWREEQAAAAAAARAQAAQASAIGALPPMYGGAGGPPQPPGPAQSPPPGAMGYGHHPHPMYGAAPQPYGGAGALPMPGVANGAAAGLPMPMPGMPLPGHAHAHPHAHMPQQHFPHPSLPLPQHAGHAAAPPPHYSLAAQHAMRQHHLAQGAGGAAAIPHPSTYLTQGTGQAAPQQPLHPSMYAHQQWAQQQQQQQR